MAGGRSELLITRLRDLTRDVLKCPLSMRARGFFGLRIISSLGSGGPAQWQLDQTSLRELIEKYKDSTDHADWEKLAQRYSTKPRRLAGIGARVTHLVDTASGSLQC
jgi:hypothetical protein